jgi:glycosyltransferase involved in cell wall biosynthesis
MDQQTGHPPARLRVLLSSFAFSPFDGSEGGVGWETATRLARHHDVTVLCGDVSRKKPTKCALEKYFSIRPQIPGLTVQYIDPPVMAQFLEWLHRWPALWAFYWIAYQVWQRAACRVFHELHHREKFDVVHQLTYASYRAPGHLWRLPLPFFWGPVAGAAGVPMAFGTTLGLKGSWRFGLRNVGNWLERNLSFRAPQAARIARLVWVSGREEQRVIERWGGRTECLLETGTTIVDKMVRDRPRDGPLRIVWSGQHNPGKALPLFLASLARLKRRVSIHVDILGTGPETQAWRALACRLNIDPLMRWHGQLPRTEALSVMEHAHVLLHSSLKEATATVILEALSLGLPVICHDVSGMSLAVTEECGIKVPLRNPETSILGFTGAIEQLAQDQELYQRLSEGAYARARDLAWDRKVQQISQAYLAATTSATR